MSNKPHVRILEIGANIKPRAQQMWPEDKLQGYQLVFETMDADAQFNPTHLCDAANPPEEFNEQFNIIIAAHVLEHFPWYDTEVVFQKWVKMLKPGGEMWIIVPSAEHVAWRIVSGTDDLSDQAHSYAGMTTEYDWHGSYFTMRRLRAMFERAKLAVKNAQSQKYQIAVLGTEHIKEEHIIMGVKGNDLHI